MNFEAKKAADNTSSSYLSLKAELLRKKQDIQRASSSSASSSSILDHLQSTSSSLKLKSNTELDVEVANPSKKKKKNDETPAPPPSSSSTLSREDEVAFAKSRAILEAKAKLYDQIMSNNDMKLLAEDDGDDDENDKSFLVDFERKIYETNDTKKQVEYTDSFGRTRLVTPEEYERLQVAEVRQSPPRTAPATTEDEIRRVERLHREQMRSKWEADMEALRNKADVHYQDVLFDEKREHGVGFYKFSTDDNQRAEQMATLNELRNKTRTEQVKFVQEKEKRQSSMAERLNKIRLRKAKEMGIDLSDQNRDEDVLTTVTPDLPIREPEKLEPANAAQSSNEEDPAPPVAAHSDDKPKPVSPPKVVPTPQPPLVEPKAQPTPVPLAPVSKPAPNGSSLAYPFPIMRAHHLS